MNTLANQLRSSTELIDTIDVAARLLDLNPETQERIITVPGPDVLITPATFRRLVVLALRGAEATARPGSRLALALEGGAQS